MTRKLLTLCVFLLFAMYAGAQSRVVTGTVTTKEDGLPLPGASVRVKGTNTGTQTDAAGKFTLTVSGPSVTLVVTSLGYKPFETSATSGPVSVAMVNDENSLTEVVVTGAFGTTQTARSTTTNAQVVSGEKLNTIRQTDLNNALAGKVAGIQVRSQSVAALGRETEVRLRGASGFGTGSGALYIVDGTILPTVTDINMDDVESVSVLQGPAATAQFGSQAANGAVVITMKKGRNAPGVGVTVNIGAQFDKVSVLPNYQNTYAGGSAADLTKYTYKATDPVEWKALDGKYYPDYADDSSWGPRMVGQEYIPWYAWYPGSEYSYKTASLTPQPNNSKDFFNTGVTLNNSISISQSKEGLAFNLTYGNQDVGGLLPNSKLKKNTLNLIASYDLNKHLTVSANINYINRVLHGNISDDYSNPSTGSLNSWYHRDIDMGIMKELRNLKSPQGEFATWNHANPTAYDPSNPTTFYGANYWYNFYTFFDQTNYVNNRDRLYGNVSVNYKVNDALTFSGTYRKQQSTVWEENKVSTSLETSGVQTGQKGSYYTLNSSSNRQNIEFLATYKKNIKDFNINANAGSDFFSYVYKANYGNTVQGLNIPDLYTLSNSVNAAVIGNDRVEEKYRALFAKASIGYKNFVFIDGTIRKDWFSTLRPDAIAVVSKSIGASFLFSDLLKQYSWLSNGKLRASWGQIPLALGETNERFGAYRYPGLVYNINSFKWGNNFLMSAPDGSTDPMIKGAVTTQREIGLDLAFFKNALTFSATYWEGTDKEFPYSLSLNGASGITSLLTNIGLIERSGFEFQLGGRPVQLPNFTWNINATYSPLIKNDVIELSKKYGVTSTGPVGGAGVWGTTMPTLQHVEGKRWGQIIGNGIKRINGQPVLDNDGTYVNDPNVDFGSVLPKHTGGLQNAFTVFNDFTVNANIDWQIGGKFVSLSNMWGSYSGLTERTAALNDKGNPVRDAVADGGGKHVFGVNAEGNPVDYYVEAKTYYQSLFSKKTFDEFIYDLTYVKLREVSIGYNIPVKKLKLGFVQSANFSVVARNPVLIYAKTKDFDPSEVDALIGETGQLPGTRGFGFNLKIGF